MSSTTNPPTRGRLDGHHVLITGGGGGIGLATAAACLAAGARCSIVDIGAQPCAPAAALIALHPQALGYTGADITDPAQVARMISQAQGRFGPVHTLVNNAGVFDLAPLLESDAASWDRIFSVNVKGMFFVMQAVLASMIESGVTGASVINLASQAGRRGEALVSHYCASKAAVISYTQSAAQAMARRSIRINAVAPGVVDTPMWDHVDSLFARQEGLPLGEKKRRVGRAVPLGRMGAPDDVADVIVFLASDEARYITGQTLNVDGGNVMS